MNWMNEQKEEKRMEEGDKPKPISISFEIVRHWQLGTCSLAAQKL